MDFAPGQVSLEASPSRLRARPYRHPVHTLAYVRIDHGNGGIIRNLSEAGMAIQAVGRLHPEQVVHLRFEIIRPRARFDLVAQVTWADTAGQAGLRFTEVSPRMRRLLKDWLFTDLLIAAMELSPAASPLLKPTVDDGLVMSAAPVQPIQLEGATGTAGSLVAQAAIAGVEDEEMPVRFSWWPADIQPRTLSRVIDGLVLLAAVLLFSLIAVQMTNVFPSWPVLAISEAAIALVLGLVYRYLCYFVVGTTLGSRLAQLAAEDLAWMATGQEDVPRFR